MELLDAENLCLEKRRRGPKPLSVRARFAATAWLDGDIVWSEGRVVWRVGGEMAEVGSRELDAASRALCSLKRHDKMARRHCADFDSWHAHRVGQWLKARELAAIRAPDLASLAMPSRRRNPAALQRLTQLLAVESSVAEPLPVSPARALFEAWPLSQEPLRRLLADENQLLEARALAALIVGAAQPRDALPGEPFLRRTARYGARFGFPHAPQLVVSLLHNVGHEAEMHALRVGKLLESRAPFAFEVSQLMALYRAKKDAASVADLAEAALRLPDPFPSLHFTSVVPKRFDYEAQRAISECWNTSRVASQREFRDVLLQIARRGIPRDLERVSDLMAHFISAPLRALGVIQVEKARQRKRRQCEIPAFAESVSEGSAGVLKFLKAIADAPDLEILELLHEILPQCSACSGSGDLPSKAWAQRWANYVTNQRRRNFTPLLNLSSRFGVPAAREALRLECWEELSRHRDLQPDLFQLALQIKAWAPDLNSDAIGRIAYLGQYWNGAPGARAAIFPVVAALEGAASDERALWLGEVLDGIEWSRRGARRELPALARFLPAMRRVMAASGEKLSPWTLIEVALELWRIAPDEESASEARFTWLADEMTQRVAALDDSRKWSHLAGLVSFLTQLAQRDEAKFRALMSASWRFAADDTDFKWSEIRRGAKLTRTLPLLETILADNFARCPSRCFTLLERLGPLDHFDPIREPLQEWHQRAQIAPEFHWSLDLDDEMHPWAARFVTAKQELGEAQTPPALMLKIASWPQKMKGEVAALQARSELTPHLKKRLENLVSRLEDVEGLHATMRVEMFESLRNATVEAELRVAELAVELCYRTRLEILGAPKNVVLTPNLINAALFSTDIDRNRKWLRKVVRAGCENSPSGDWRLAIEGNARFLQRLSERGLNREAWLAPAPRSFLIGSERIELRLENCPLQILQMGNYFNTCLSRGGCNAFSSVANAVELNKRVVFARDSKGRVVGRQLLALSRDDKLLGFYVYASVGGEATSQLRAAFGSYAHDFAARCGLELGDKGEVEQLFVSDWYDDGTIVWSELMQTPPSTALPL